MVKMLTIQFGQCGNQLGHNFFSNVITDVKSTNTGVSYTANYEYTENTIEKWFDGITKHGQHFARAILIDTEEKAVNKIREDANAAWTYRSDNVICHSDGGSANNWAYGYRVNSRNLSDTISNTTRQEIEKLDHFQGFLLLLSSAGGTGSGIGSYTVELLREEYKTKPIIATIALPFNFGEVCTQSYNTVLTVATFHNKADFSILFENDRVHSICTNLLKNSNPTLYDMNNIISQNLLAAFQPTSNDRYSVNSLVSNLAAHPKFKFVTIRSTPYAPATSLQFESTHKWDVYIRHLKQSLRTSRSQVELANVELKLPSSISNSLTSPTYSSCVSNVLITRGKSMKNDIITTEELQQRHLYSDWTALRPFTHLHQERQILNQNKFLTLISNNSQIHKLFDSNLRKAWGSYNCAAFLHRYKVFDVEKDDLLQAFAKVENIVHEYKNLKCHSGN